MQLQGIIKIKANVTIDLILGFFLGKFLEVTRNRWKGGILVETRVARKSKAEKEIERISK